MKRIFIYSVITVLILSCGGETSLKKEAAGKFTVSELSANSELAVISTQFGEIVIEFFPNTAPVHVESFLTHAREGYFNKSTFHRVIPGFVIQGGDPNSKDEDRSNDGFGGRAANYYGVGNPDNPETWMLPSEFSDRPHLRGTLSMARSREFDSAGSQFFICVDDVRRLDTKYTVFGQVIEGMEVVDTIVNTRRDKKDNPETKVAMRVKVVTRDNL